MRVNLTKPMRAKPGDLVSVTCWLGAGQKDARVSIWSATKGHELSPHIPRHLIELIGTDGKPNLLKPMSFRLGEHKTKHRMQFFADEALMFVVRQEVDLATDDNAKARIECYGQHSQAFRRYVRNTVRACRNFAARLLGTD